MLYETSTETTCANVRWIDPFSSGVASIRSRLGWTACLLLAAVLFAGCEGQSSSSAALRPQVDAERVSDLLAELSTVAPDKAYEKALGESDPYVRHLLLASTYARIGKGEIQAVHDVFTAKGTVRDGIEARAIGSLWGHLDVENGLLQVLDWERPVLRERGAEALMGTVVRSGNARALLDQMTVIQDQVGPGVHQAATKAMIDALFENREWDLGVDVLADVEDTEVRSALTGAAMLAANRYSFDEFRTWVEGINLDESRPLPIVRELSSLVLKVLVKRDPAEGKGWYEEHLAGTSYGDGALAILTNSTWARENPEEALSYVRSRPSGERLEFGLRSLAYQWLRSGGLVAKEKLLAVAEEDERYEGLFFPLAQFMVQIDVENSVKLARRVPNAEEQHEVLKQGLMRWTRMDPDAVDRYVAENPVSPALRKSISIAKSIRGARREKEAANAGGEG